MVQSQEWDTKDPQELSGVFDNEALSEDMGTTKDAP
jgi:hypothetical protein